MEVSPIPKYHVNNRSSYKNLRKFPYLVSNKLWNVELKEGKHKQVQLGFYKFIVNPFMLGYYKKLRIFLE
jgi:hypothetical protein